MIASSFSGFGLVLTETLSKLVRLIISNSLSWSLNTDDKSRLFLRFPCKLSTYDLVGYSIIAFGNVKVELSTIECCSSDLNFSSGSKLNSDDSS